MQTEIFTNILKWRTHVISQGKHKLHTEMIAWSHSTLKLSVIYGSAGGPHFHAFGCFDGFLFSKISTLSFASTCVFNKVRLLI